ncbi:YdeI/OmpD-associated family protein, partial [Xanthovirga aplysinae]|uniref:YdeI/OmpD-associated family protein n=1 Tax=Xanthovirga aplysinae TaxID=2529853 RepID=UPI0012BC0FBB
WIDSVYKTLDDDHNIQRFSPRKHGSAYSQANIERLDWLFKNKLIHYSLVESIGKVLSNEFVFASDILSEIKKDKVAWKNFMEFSDSYKRIRIAYIESARNRPEEFKKRLLNFLKKTKENKLIKGFG